MSQPSKPGYHLVRSRCAKRDEQLLLGKEHSLAPSASREPLQQNRNCDNSFRRGASVSATGLPKATSESVASPEGVFGRFRSEAAVTCRAAFPLPVDDSRRTATIARKRMGTPRNAPTGPHIQLQHAMERKTRNGLIVSR